MSSLRTRIPVGSAPWIVSERRQASVLVEQDVEEFSYSVRNEMEWLNEHMNEIFTANQLNVTDIFKTPGKLRGKTPRTARKRNALGNRAFQVAEDAGNEENQPAVAGPSAQNVVRGNANTDSGYHGTTDDEMELVKPVSTASTASFHFSPPGASQELAPNVSETATAAAVPAEERRVTEESFVSAKETLASRNGSQEELRKEQQATSSDLEMARVAVEMAKVASQQIIPAQQTQSEHQAIEPMPMPVERATQPAEESIEADLDRMDDDDIRSPSDASSPVKPLLRKSSLTFASLPAREPLANKKSIGARTSHVEQHKAPLTGRLSQLGRYTGGKSMGGQQYLASSAAQDDGAIDVDAAEKPTIERQESETTKMHHQTTTQRLHDRINMLGQSRSSKSNPFNPATIQPVYPQLPQVQPENDPVRPTPAQTQTVNEVQKDDDDDDDDWIAPVTTAPPQAQPARPLLLKTRTAEQLPGDAQMVDPDYVFSANQRSPKHRFSPSRAKLPFGQKKVVSASALASPTRSAMTPGLQKAISVSNPPFQYGLESTTPAGSPRRHPDGPLSATKAKLYSALRSAKGIFASSAGVSAQAKMEALSPGPRAKQQLQVDHLFSPTEGCPPEPALYPNLGSSSRVTSAESAASTSTDGRRTRSSSEREHRKQDEEAKQQRKMAGELDKAREKERQKAAAAAAKKLHKSPSKERIATTQRPAAPSRAESERSKDVDVDSADEMPPPPPPKSLLPTTQSQRLREPRRIAKPMKDAPSKMKPAPVTVRMPSQRLGHLQQPSTSSLSQSLHESLPPPVPPKPTLTSKMSSSSLHTASSTTSLKGTGSSQAAKKALEAAAKKKEQDAKAAQRKAEAKREMEQRRAAKVEEERRRQEEERRRQDEERRRQEDERRADQQRKLAEQQRREEAKRAVQKQGLEAKRAEQQRKEAQRVQQNDFAHAIQQEKAQGPYGHSRADLGNARPISRLNLVQDPHRPPIQMNTAKPAKRALQTDAGDEQPSRPGLQRNPPSYKQLDAKRRKTNESDDEDEIAEPRRSVMAPPVRHSNIRKDTTKFVHGYAPAPPATQHAASMFVKTVTAQHNMQHGKPGPPNDMAKYASARIPFAEAPNPPAGPPGQNTQHKTPGRPIPNSSASTARAVKSSPHYPNGDAIALPEIATDSEDEDSENEFQAPDWVNSPALRELLSQQQLVDPEQIFGPIAPLRMEEVFKNKDRHKKFRDRTSSANWNGADRLTDEERAKDREARERLMREGGWTFQPNP